MRAKTHAVSGPPPAGGGGARRLRPPAAVPRSGDRAKTDTEPHVPSPQAIGCHFAGRRRRIRPHTLPSLSPRAGEEEGGPSSARAAMLRLVVAADASSSSCGRIPSEGGRRRHARPS
eukprot:scaffold1883_cov396-Prasinococcus_capsulatus_cf.AAC.27